MKIIFLHYKKIIASLLSFYSCYIYSASAAFGIEKVDSGIIGTEETQIGFVIQDIIIYLLGFLALIAVVYIIWAGFTIMTAVGDEEKVKQAKKRIIFAAIGLLVIFTAWQITEVIIDLADSK